MPKIPFLSFKRIYNFGNYLAITPPYDFKKHSLSEGNLFKFYVVFIGVSSIIGESWSMYYRSKMIKTFRTSIRVCDLINETTLFATYITMKFDLCLLKRKKWGEILALIRYLNKHLRNKPNKKPVKMFLTGQLIVGHFCFFVFSIYQWVALCKTDKIALEFAATYIIHYISYYNIVYLIILMNAFLFMLEKKLKILSNNFKERFISAQQFTSSDVSNTKCVEIIREVDFFVRKVNDAVDLFNNLFGYVIFFKVTNIVINVIVMINVTFLSSFLGSYDSGINGPDVVISNILATCFAMSWTVVFVLLCQRVINEAKGIVNLCYILQGQVSIKSEEREELLKLAIMAGNKIPVFSASGYFEINKNTLTSIFGTVTTYVIVLIQLNISMF